MESASREEGDARGAALACPQCGARYGAEARFCPADGSKLATEPEDPLLGQLLFGQIRIERRIAEGGMGVVYRARQVGLDRPIALKVLHRALAFDPEARGRFEREARICARIDHPSVVRVLLSGHLPDGHPFLAMELLEGRTLEQLLRERGALAPAEAVPLLRAVCGGVGAAHALGIVHRDLKPDNVVVALGADGKERVKVLDFGVARMLDGGDGTKTRSGLVFGTARYISPEGALGEPTDPRSDVYSVGVMAYRMLAGRLPFEGATSVAVLMKHAHEPVPPLAAPAGAPPIPERLAEVVLRALAKRPQDRYADARELGTALGTSIAGRDGEWSPLATMTAVNGGEPSPVSGGRPAWPASPSSATSTSTSRSSEPGTPTPSSGSTRALPGRRSASGCATSSASTRS